MKFNEKIKDKISLGLMSAIGGYYVTISLTG
jgi:hypothetical protein